MALKVQQEQKNTFKIMSFLYILMLVSILLVGYVFVYKTWNISMKAKEDEAKQLVAAAEAVFPKSLLATLDGNISDIEKAEYKVIKNGLKNLVKQENEIRFAYIYIIRNDHIYILADSESIDSKDYSPRGQEYTEASEEYFLPFIYEQTVITKPTSDRWGEWISVLVPMKNNDTGKTIAIFGADYPADVWNNHAITRMFQAIFVVICILLILIFLFFAKKQNKKLLAEKKKLNDSERSKAVLLDNLPGMGYRCNYDRDWTMQFVSEGCYSLTGYKAESLLQNKVTSFNELIHPRYQDYLWKKWAQILKKGSKLKEEYEIITASGEVKWVFEQGLGVYDDDGNLIALEGLIIDITERKQQEMKLKYINEHDALTGLYNRRYFQEFMLYELNRDREELRGAILLINLKKFNIVDLTFGYIFAEKLMKELAAGLSSLCTNDCQLFHIANNSFVFYIRDYKNKDELIALSEAIIHIQNSILATKTIGGNVGILEIDNIKYDADNLLKYASIAAENISSNIALGYNFFDRKMEDKILREVEIKNELTTAIMNRDAMNLYVQYQPILDLKTNRVKGFEALARLKSDKLGNVSPAEFIPIAEETQLIVPLGKSIMSIVFTFLYQLEGKGYDDIIMSFNVSAIQLLRDDFLFDLIEIIKETKVDSSKIVIEITESVFSDNYKEINQKLEKIKELGIKIAIDDFGTGYSSLARGGELNVNCLKIDKCFIDKLIGVDIKKPITSDIISMAHKLGYFVIAEGVEHEKQKQYLIEHSCDLMQGYFYSKPLSQELAIEMLSNTIINNNE